MGHIRRCLSLAGALGGHGLESLFQVDGDGSAADLIGREGYAVWPEQTLDPRSTLRLAQERGAAAVIVDTYAAGRRYFRGLRHGGLEVVVIDDLADRHIEASLLINGSAGAEDLDYSTGVRTCLLGPRYMLLRPEFAGEPRSIAPDRISSVLVTTGGGDPCNLSRLLVEAVREALPTCRIDLLIGPFAAPPAKIPGQGGLRLHRNPANLRELMIGCDLAVSAGGQTLYELAAAATPAIAIQVSDNQRLNIASLEAAGALAFAGEAGDRDLPIRLKALLQALDVRPNQRLQMGRAGRAMVDGRGAERAAAAIARLMGPTSCHAQPGVAL
jgi:spore coat polysaccharide biosynthesis predicted glycosyltransferase SpsG